MIAASVLATTAIAMDVAEAQTQPFERILDDTTWNLEVGGGGVYGFAPLGDDPYKLNFTPWVSFSHRDRVYANLLDGVGYNVVKTDRLRMGAQLRPSYTLDSDVEGLDRPSTGVDLTGYAFTRLPANFVVGGRIERDVTGASDGFAYYASLARRDITRIGLLQSTVYTRAGGDRRARAYYGVTEAEEAATGIDGFEPDGGFQAVGAGFLMMTPIGDRYAIGAFANYERVLGDAARSPLVRRSEAEENILRTGVVLVRRFTSTN
ncbi:MipA/OmpV family protein [Parvularcula oceani]|uniref:MipA/OmpV family protein n=1 Tax=Parvularcula oceani TaxID=1247963 RepID=UPI0004E16B3E|nr:MipA/OmpV family protein [Parvularcula oceani]